MWVDLTSSLQLETQPHAPAAEEISHYKFGVQQPVATTPSIVHGCQPFNQHFLKVDSMVIRLLPMYAYFDLYKRAKLSR